MRRYHIYFEPFVDSILENIGKVETIDDLFRIAPRLSDF